MQIRKKRLLLYCILLAAIFFSLPAAAEPADPSVLPEDLKIIGEEAFARSSFTELQLPAGVEEIHSRAFAESTLTAVNLPSSLTYIADDAFDGTEAVLVVEEGSFAQDWAREHNVFSVIGAGSRE